MVVCCTELVEKFPGPRAKRCMAPLLVVGFARCRSLSRLPWASDMRDGITFTLDKEATAAPSRASFFHVFMLILGVVGLCV